MTTSSRYPSTPLGQELGRFYEHRSILRRTIPLFSITWKDCVRFLKGEAAMVSAVSPQAVEVGASRNAPRHAAHHHNRHAHA